MADERVRRIQETVVKAQALRALQARQSQIAQTTKESVEKAEREAIRTKNIERLERNGVVGLFRGLRDAGVVKWSDDPVIKYQRGFLGKEKAIRVGDYDPARIQFSSNGDSVSLLYDMWSYDAGDSSMVEECREISAGFNETGNLVIEGVLVAKQKEMEEVITARILSNPNRVRI